MTLNHRRTQLPIQCEHGRVLRSLGLHLEDGIHRGFRPGVFVFEDEDPLA